MAYGVNILSDSGKIAFSTDYNSYRLLGKYSVTKTVPGGGPRNYCSITITSSSTPICFVKPNYDSDYVAVDNMTNSGSSWTIQFSASSIQSTYTTLTLYVFTADNEADTGYGINVWNPAGAIAFSTKYRTLKLSGWIISTPQAPTSFPSISLTSGTIPTNFAVNAPAIGWAIYQVSPTTWTLTNIGLNKQSSTTAGLNTARSLIQFGGGSDAINILGNLYIMYIDSSLYD